MSAAFLFVSPASDEISECSFLLVQLKELAGSAVKHVS
jgi:hypothetical protein